MAPQIRKRVTAFLKVADEQRKNQFYKDQKEIKRVKGLKSTWNLTQVEEYEVQETAEEERERIHWMPYDEFEDKQLLRNIWC